MLDLLQRVRFAVGHVNLSAARLLVDGCVVVIEVETLVCAGKNGNLVGLRFNAQIGVAKAAYFPQISLTAALGGQSSQLSSLFAGPKAVYSFVPQVSQPIFSAGKLKSGVKLAEAERDSALVQYEKAISTAFGEVSNALIAHQRVRESRVHQQALVAALEDRKRLSYMRYRGGVDTQLNALDSDRDLFQSELTLAQLKRNEILSVVQLYKALGGGWQN